MSGPLEMSEPVRLRIPPIMGEEPGDLAVASNGADYLVAWSEGRRFCGIPTCMVDPFRVFAARVSDDGHVLDENPIVIEERKRHAAGTAAAWDGSNYVVTWVGARDVVAARVSSQGIVSGVVGGAGTVVDHSEPYRYALTRLAGLSGGVVLFIRRSDESNPPMQTWRAVRIDSGTDLFAVSGLPRVDIVTDDEHSFGHLAASGRGPLVLVAYDRIDMTLGGVPRVFLRTYADESRRRAVRR